MHFVDKGAEIPIIIILSLVSSFMLKSFCLGGIQAEANYESFLCGKVVYY